MKILLFGGAFNPIHIGHIGLCRLFLDEIKPDLALLVPSHSSPHKSNSALIDDANRLKMCALAASSLDGCQVCDIEIKREGTSYTADTLFEIKTIYPDAEIYLVCGSDMFLTIDTWYHPDEIFSNAIICTARRGDEDEAIIRKKGEYLETLGAKTMIINSALPDVSSTMIRKMAQNGEDFSAFVPQEVYKYIIENGLYK